MAMNTLKWQGLSGIFQRRGFGMKLKSSQSNSSGGMSAASIFKNAPMLSKMGTLFVGNSSGSRRA